MTRRFKIEYRADGPIANATWYIHYDEIPLSKVEEHCRNNRISWEKGLFRLTELKPIEVKFNTTILLEDIK